MADLTGGRLVARVLKEAGVGHVFTLCGGHILPIYDGCLDEGIEQYAHENEPSEPATDDLTPEEREQIERELNADQVLKDESLAIAADVIPPLRAA